MRDELRARRLHVAAFIERAALQREINRLQELGAADGAEIDALWQKKKDLLHRIEQLT